MPNRLLEHIEPGASVHDRLSHGGVIHSEPELPFILVYREPADRDDAGTRRLVATEAAYLVANREEGREAAEIVRELAEAGSQHFGAFLVLEIWSGADPMSHEIVVHGPTGPAPETVGKLVEALEPVAALHPGVQVRLQADEQRTPPGMKDLISVKESWRQEVLLIGLEIPPVFRDPESGQIFPRFLRRLQHALSRALRQALYEFSRVQTTSTIQNPLALGTHTLPDAVWKVDHELCELEHSFDPLLMTFPVNAPEAWHQFEVDKYQKDPEFHYRLLPIDPDLYKRKLFAIEIEAIDDPAVADLFEDKRRELDTQLTMLRERGTVDFRYSSQRLYGTVDERLATIAAELLDTVPKPKRWTGEWVDAEGFRLAANEELDYYRERYPNIENTVQVRPDLSGLLVSEGNLMIGRDLRIREDRLAPLIHHEVGTHVVTFINGSAQPLEQLSLGLADYDEFQEGLAVLAEYLAGGLDRLRMRLLAARVLAVRSVQEGATFVDTFRLLRDEFGYTAKGAWHVAVRVHASGGSMRDMIYLRGLVDVIDLLQEGAEIEPLYIGKMARRHLPTLEELRYREVLRDPPLLPRLLSDPEARERLDTVREGITLTEMICPENP